MCEGTLTEKECLAVLKTMILKMRLIPSTVYLSLILYGSSVSVTQLSTG